LPGRGRDAEELAAMNPVPRKAAKYLVFFTHHPLYPVIFRKRGAECAITCLKPPVVAGERIEFNKIKGHEIVHPIEPTLIENILNETEDRGFVLRARS
jgi:hypothetical protein